MAAIYYFDPQQKETFGNRGASMYGNGIRFVRSPFATYLSACAWPSWPLNRRVFHPEFGFK